MVNNREAIFSKQIHAVGPRASGHSHVTVDSVLSSERPPWESEAEGVGAYAPTSPRTTSFSRDSSTLSVAMGEWWRTGIWGTYQTPPASSDLSSRTVKNQYLLFNKIMVFCYSSLGSLSHPLIHLWA